MIIFIVTCGSAIAADYDDFIGTWILTSLESDGKVQDPQRFGLSIQLQMNQDGSFSLVKNNVGLEGAWVYAQNNFYILSGQKMESYGFSFEDENLILDKNDVRYIFSPETAEEDADLMDVSDAAAAAETPAAEESSPKSGGVITGAQCSTYPAYLTKGDSAEIISVQAVPIYADDLKTIHTYAYPGKTFTINSQPYCKGGVNYYYVNFNGWEGLLQETMNDIYVIHKVE